MKHVLFYIFRMPKSSIEAAIFLARHSRCKFCENSNIWGRDLGIITAGLSTKSMSGNFQPNVRLIKYRAWG